MRWLLVFSALVATGCGGTTSISTSTNGAAGAVAAQGGSTGGGGVGETGGGGTGGSSSLCTEIRLGPPGLFTNQDNWVRIEDGLIKTVGAEVSASGDHPLFVREFEPSGALVNEFIHPIAQEKPLPLDCAWKGSTFLCTKFDLVALGGSSKPDDFSWLGALDVGVISVGSHWDGEAFAVHLVSDKFGDGTVELLRYNTEGKIIQERTHVAKGATYASTNERARVVTDPVSGRTFVVKGLDAPYLQVSAHERDGTALFPMGTLLEVSPHLSTSYPAVGVYPEGALVVTNGDYTAKNWWPKPHFYHISADGQITTLPDIPLPERETTLGGSIGIAIFVHDANHAWIVVNSGTKSNTVRLVVLEWKDGNFGPLQVVMDSQDEDLPESPLLPFDLRDLVAFEVAGQKWIGLNDYRSPGARTPRLFRVDDPSCRYTLIKP